MNALFLLLATSLPAADPVPLLPPIVMGDLYRFPDCGTAMAATAFAGRHIDYLNVQCTVHPHGRGGWELRRDAAYERLRVWECLVRIHRHGEHDTQSRLADLGHLREMLGAEAFYFGNMPCPVPLEWFQDLPHPPPDRPAIPRHPDPPPGWRKPG